MRSSSEASTIEAIHTRLHTRPSEPNPHSAARAPTAATATTAASRTSNTKISAILARALLDAAEAHGASRQNVQAAAGCTLGERAWVGEWVDLARFSRMIEAAVEQTADPAFGLHWGERAPLMNFGIVASLAHWSPSPRTALTALTQFQGLLFQGQPVASFQTRGHLATLRCDLGLLHPAARRTWAEFVVVGASLLLQQLFGRDAAKPRVSFDHAAPTYEREYQRILGDAVVAFESGACAVEFDAARLDVSLPQFNERLGEAVLFEANCALARVGGEQRCSARVREQLASSWPNVPTMDDMARKLGVSSRTLRRHLEQERTAYPTLVAEALRSRALRLLGNPQASVKEVAYALGFATPSAFHRAFKRWTGSSPSEARAGSVSVDR